jgi:endonuclease/exonuclease/phosphatase family metal-dependent hydrolase
VLRVLNLIIFPLTIVVGLLLTAAGLAMFIPPKFSSWLPLLGLLFPFLFVINLFFLVYWWIQLKFKLIIPLCFAIFNLIHASKYVQYTGKASKLKKDFIMATYNTQLFGAMSSANTFDTVLHKVKTDSLDILCLQEVYAQKDLKKHLLDLKEAGNFKMYSFFRLQPERPYGMAILSKFRIVGSGKVGIGSNTGNMAIWVDMLVNDDTVRVYNLHLQSIRFNKKDYDFIRQSPKSDEGRIEGSKNLVRRIREAYVKRAEQADSVAAHMDTCRHPMLVAGDFNDVPLSYAYQTISNGLLDAFRERGTGFERTYKGPFPSFRIDYILFSKRFICTDYDSYTNIPGDHKLVRATFHVPLKAQ